MTRLLIPLALLAACQATPPTPEPTTGPPLQELRSDSCNAASFADLRDQPRSALQQRTLPEGTRVIGPRDIVTMDYIPTRLNLYLDTGGAITRISCG